MVSVPLRGNGVKEAVSVACLYMYELDKVSVPLRGNGVKATSDKIFSGVILIVSVPLRGNGVKGHDGMEIQSFNIVGFRPLAG